MLLAGSVTFDGFTDQGAPMVGTPGLELVRGQPDRLQDAGVQRPLRVVIDDVCFESHAQEGLAVAGLAPQPDAQEVIYLDPVPGLFQGLAHRCVKQVLVGVQMTRGLVQHHPSAHRFLDEQVTTLVLDDGGDGHVGLEILGHGGCFLAGTVNRPMSRFYTGGYGGTFEGPSHQEEPVMRLATPITLLLLLSACGGSETGSGDGLVLRNAQVGSTLVLSEPDLAATIDRKKHVCNVPDGTAVEKLEEGRGSAGAVWYRIRVLEGSCEGRDGWVNSLMVGPG